MAGMTTREEAREAAKQATSGKTMSVPARAADAASDVWERIVENHRSVIAHLTDGEVARDGYWWGLDETSVPTYKGEPLTEGEKRVFEEMPEE